MGEKFSVDTSENRRLKQSIEQYADRAIEGIHDYLYSLLTDDLMIPCDDGDERETVIENELRGVEYIIKKELDGLKFWDKRERLFEYTVHRGFIWHMVEPPVYGKQFLFDEEGGPPMTVDEFEEYLWKEYPECMAHEVEQILDGFRRAENQKQEVI